MLETMDALLPVYAQMPVRPVSGHGSWLVDEEGNEWLDAQLVKMGLPPIGDMSKEEAIEYMEDILKAHREWLIKNGPQE